MASEAVHSASLPPTFLHPLAPSLRRRQRHKLNLRVRAQRLEVVIEHAHRRLRCGVEIIVHHGCQNRWRTTIGLVPRKKFAPRRRRLVPTLGLNKRTDSGLRPQIPNVIRQRECDEDCQCYERAARPEQVERGRHGQKLVRVVRTILSGPGLVRCRCEVRRA